MIERPKPEAVEQGHWSGTHSEHVAEDATDAGCGALIGLDRGRVVVGLDLEGHRPALGKPEHARVLPRSLDDKWAGGRKSLEDRSGVLIRAMLRP